ncbi:PH domain-containing protein [Enterococcus rivorum]|uniref:Uncharacterized protein n=1 Tax=Enterococcus rivorum TaxID=762845 RepID=A0A1E5KZF6_9ENTE|nr:PH domain-containing protein [Enterococcus rivorum]MBP2099375.1 hypothetical protein [Enterococcus rivorum]OEH83240.1 hypothetical protein BCR26_10575 [Enterococcus rivorum]
MNFILLLTLISVYLLMALVGRIPANPHKNVLLETTLPGDKLNHPQVLQISQTYKKRLLQVATIFSVITLPILFIPLDSIIMIFFFLVLFGFIGTNYYLQIVYIHKMTALKIANGWLLPTSPILVDTKLVLNKNNKLLTFWWFLPSFFITLGGCVYSILILGFSFISVLFILLTIFITGLFVLSYYLIARLPVKPLTSDEKINQQVNDTMRRHWSLYLVISTVVLSPIAFLPAISIALPYEKAVLISLIYLTLIILFIGFTFYYLFDMRKKQDQLISQAKEYRYSDDDQYWRYGIYINPNDKRIMIPDRVGMNLSINLGRPAGKIALGITGLIVLAALTVATIPMLISDFSTDPFQLTTTDKGITLAAPLTSTKKILWDDIESVKLVDSVPENRLRVFGTALDNYLTGEFKINNEPAYLLVFTKATPVLQIKTNDTLIYYTNKESELTKQAYKMIQKKLK